MSLQENKSIEQSDNKKYKCKNCGYIFDESLEQIKFSLLPDYWVCPGCGANKCYFFIIIN